MVRVHAPVPRDLGEQPVSRRPIRPQLDLPRVTRGDAIDPAAAQRLADEVNRRLKNVESATRQVYSLSGSVDSAIASAASTSTAALSATLDAQRVSDGLDYLRGVRKEDDFMDALTSTITTSNGSNFFLIDEEAHPGILRMAVQTPVDSAVCSTYWLGDANGGIRLGGGAVRYECVFRIYALDDGINDSRKHMGIYYLTSGLNPTDGVWFAYDREQNLGHSIRFRTAATGSQADIYTGVRAQAGLWYRAVIEVAPAADAATGSLYCTGSLISVTKTRTYIPTAGVAVMGAGETLVKTGGTTATRYLDIDYRSYTQLITGSRY